MTGRPRRSRTTRAPRRGPAAPPSVGIVGLGYVGTATALAFAHYGQPVVAFDLLESRRAEVRSGRLDTAEAGLAAELRRSVRGGRLKVADSVADVVTAAPLVLLSVPTPSGNDGAVDLGAVEAAARAVGHAIRGVPGWRSVVLKSTAVPGTCDGLLATTVAAASGREIDRQVGVGANPEFLAEGSLVADALHPSRIVLGVRESRTERLLRRAYRRFPAPVLVVPPAVAELVKYTSNALLATKVSFANEIASVAESLGVDVDRVMDGVGLDPRLGRQFLAAGPGFGGSCFDKDVRALVAFAGGRGIELLLARSTLEVNARQAVHVVDLAEGAAGPLSGRTVALLGLSFKPGTEDVRGSQAYPILEELLRRGAAVRLHDPSSGARFLASMPAGAPSADPDRVRLCSTFRQAISDAQVAIVHADWPVYRNAPASAWAAPRLSVVVDTRRTLSARKLAGQGIRVVGLGR